MGQTIAGTETRHVESIVLDNGTEYPVRVIEISEDEVFLKPSRAGTGSVDESRMTLREEDRDREVRIPVIEEKIEIGNREVSFGGVRVHSEVKERPVEEEVRLQRGSRSH